MKDKEYFKKKIEEAMEEATAQDLRLVLVYLRASIEEGKKS